MGANSVRLSPFWEGVKTSFPFAIGAIPVGIIFGASASAEGFTALQTMASSLFILGGSSQILAVTLLKQNAATLFIILGALTINLRHMVYSASLAETSKAFTKRTQGVLSYLLTDECFTALNLKMMKNEKVCDRYFFGAGITLWALWQIATLVGAFAGKNLPSWLHFEYATDFVFFAVVIQNAKTKKLQAASFLAMLISAFSSMLPYKLNVLLGAIAAAIIVSRIKLGRISLRQAKA